MRGAIAACLSLVQGLKKFLQHNPAAGSSRGVVLGNLCFCELSGGEVGEKEVDIEGGRGREEGVPEGKGGVVEGVNGFGS